MDKTPASTVRVAATITSVDVIGAALVCPVGALEHVADKDVDGVGQAENIVQEMLRRREWGGYWHARQGVSKKPGARGGSRMSSKRLPLRPLL